MSFDIASLNGQNGFITVGPGPDGRDIHGSSVSRLGDVNGDGIDDYVIGSDGGDNVPPDLAGRSHVIFGTVNGFPELIDLTQLDSFTGADDIGFTIFGPGVFAQAGFATGAAGDLNNDGLMDIVIGAPNDDVVFYGFERDVEVPVLDEDGEIVEGEFETVTVVINQDQRKAEGAAYVVYGQENFDRAVFLNTGQGANVRKFDGDVLTPAGDVQISLKPNFFDDKEVTESDFITDASGLFYGEQVGYSVGTAGDVNGDGVGDLIVGSKGDLFTPGDVFVVFGRDGQFIQDNLTPSQLNGVNGIQISGIGGNKQTGHGTTLVDLNGDGISDIVFGSNEFDASGGNSNEGRTFVVFGSDDPGYYTQKGGKFTTNDVGSTLNGFHITGLRGTLTGEVVNNAGDVNGDGYDDLLIASPGSNGFARPGQPGYQAPDSYVIWGKQGGFTNINLANLSPNDGVRITKGDNFENGGNVVDISFEFADGAGDVNSDGFDDIILGVNQKTTGTGFAHVIYGAADFGGQAGLVVMDDAVAGTGGFKVTTTDTKPLDTLNLNSIFTNFGASVGGLGDINADGAEDVAITAPFFTGFADGTAIPQFVQTDTQRERGKVAVVFGVKFEDLEGETVQAFNNAPQQSIDITVSLTNPALNRVTVDYATVNGSAVAGTSSANGDYQAASGSLTFQTGEQSKTVTLTVFQNQFTEGDEAFGLQFSNAKGAGFSVTDGQGNYIGGSTTATLDVTIQSLPNASPIANNDIAFVQEDNLVSGNLRTNDSDPDGDPLNYELLSGPSNGKATVNADGTYTYDSDPDFNGQDQFTYVVDDGKGRTDTATVTITVQPVNDAPDARDDSFQIDEDETVTGNVLNNNGFGIDSDAEGDQVTLQLASQPSNGTLTFNPIGTFTYTPDADFNGEDSFTYRASDGIASTQATVSFLILPTQDAPVARNDVFTIDENGILVGNLTSDNGNGADFDVDGDRLTVSLLSQPTNGVAATLPGGAFLYRPNTDYNGLDSFTYRLEDGEGGATTATVTISVETDESRFAVSASTDTVQEGDNGTTTVSFEITRSGRIDGTGSVAYELEGVGVNPASADDFVGGLISGTAVFAAGETSKIVTVDVIGEIVPEETESFALTLSNASASGPAVPIIVTSAATVVIEDDDEADIVGTSDNDRLRGDDGDDVIFGDDGDDRIDGRDGDDVLIGADGDDRLRGGDDDDILIGGDGSDRLDGGRGDDILIGGDGRDELKGGRDDDIFVYRPGDGRVTITDFNVDDDQIDLTAFGEAFDTLDEILAVAEEDGKDVVLEFGGSNELTLRKTDIDELDDPDLFVGL